MIARHTGGARAFWAAAVCAAAALLSLVHATPARAHPFGAPLVARVAVDGTSVTVTWRAAEDDLIALGHHLGVFDSAAAAAGASTGGQLLIGSPDTAAYLQRHVRVFQGGSDCRAVTTRLDELTAGGAVLRYDCPASQRPVDVRVTALTDIHPAYRTLVVTDGSATPRRGLLSAVASTLTLSPMAGPAAAELSAPLNMGGVERMLLSALDSPALAVLGMLAAFAVGAVHALAPGHGKTLTAAYLVGSGAGRRQAVALGAAVAVMHTLSVLVVALAWHVAAEALDLVVVTASLQLLAALVSVVVGLVLLHRRRNHHHHARPAGGRAWSWRGLGAVAVSGGILPSPTAFLVLTTGLLTGRTLIALALVALFALGLATSLSVVGCATLRGQRFLTGPLRAAPLQRVAARMPALAAAAVVAVGGLASLVSLRQLLAVLT